MGPIEPIIRPYEERSIPSELELKLKEINIPQIGYNDIHQHPEFLNVFEVLNKRFNYKSVDMELCDSDGPYGQVNRLLKLSNIKTSCETLNALAMSGYELTTAWKGLSRIPCVREEDVHVVTDIINLGLDNYLRTLKRIKKLSDKHDINYNCRDALDILTLANLEEKYWVGIETLCKCGYISFPGYRIFNDFSVIKKVAETDTRKFLNIFDALKKRFGYNSVDMENLRGAGYGIGQVERILKLSSLDNVCEILSILADADYKLSTEWKGFSHVPCILERDLDIVKKMIKGKLYKKEYYQLITKLEKQLGYKNIKKEYTQLLDLTDLFSKFRSDICEKTIDTLTKKALQQDA